MIPLRTRQLLQAGLLLSFAALLPACAGGGTATDKAQAQKDSFEVSHDRPAAPKTLYTMARILVNQHRDAEAEKLLKEAVALTPPYLPAFVTLAELQLKHNTPDNAGADAALATLSQALAAAPDDSALHNNIGMCHLARQDHESALISFTRAVDLQPQTPRYRANRAMALGLLGRYDECLALYSTFLSPADAHHNLAILCKLRGDTERASSEFARAQSLRPPSAPASPADGTPSEPRG